MLMNDGRTKDACLYYKLTSEPWADLSLHWAHMPFCWFCHEAALFLCYELKKNVMKCTIFFGLITVMILSFRTDMPGQTVQTQIRLILEEQSDQGLHCLPFRLHRLDSLFYGRATKFKF